MGKRLEMGGLFAGIGGFELAAQWAGIRPKWSNEIDDWCCKTLNKNFTHDIYKEGIHTFIDRVQRNPERFKVNIITGGFPCQPFSHAGNRNGTNDNRYLWPEMLEVIRIVRPECVIGENVAGLVSMEKGEVLDRILSDLEAEGYTPETYNIPACGVQAWHRRERVWIVAYRTNTGIKSVQERKNSICKRTDAAYKQRHTPRSNTYLNGSRRTEKHINGEAQFQHEQERKPESVCQNVPDSNQLRLQGFGTNTHQERQWQGQNKRQTGLCSGESIWDFEPAVGRVANGVSHRVDRLKGLGNAIVPQVAYELFMTIKNHLPFKGQVV